MTGRHSHANGTHGIGVAGVGSGQPVPTPINSWNNLPLERCKSKYASLSRLFKPWKWRVRRKSDKLESVSQSMIIAIIIIGKRGEIIVAFPITGFPFRTLTRIRRWNSVNRFDRSAK